MFVHDMKNRVYMNTNRDKAVSFGRDGGDVRRPVFLSMSQSRMLHPFQLRGSQSGISPVGYVNNDKLRLSGYLFR